MSPGLAFEDPILGLDIATSTGWGLLAGVRYDYGQVTFPRSSRLPAFRKWVFEVVTKHRPAVIAVEEPFINPRRSTITILHMQGVLLERLYNCVCPVLWISNTEAKKVIAGSGQMSSADKRQGAMIQALKTHGFRVTGTDAADGLAVALCARKRLFGRLT